MRVLWIAAVVLLGVACSKPKPPVRVTGKRPRAGSCESVGRAQARGSSEAEARYTLRDEAREVGADTAVIDAPVSKEPAGRYLLQAELLRCAQPKVAPVTASAGGESTAESTTEAAAPAAAAEPNLEERLAKLQKLFDEGLITQEDYDTRRRELLQEL